MDRYVSAKYLTDHLLPETAWICSRESNSLSIILRNRKTFSVKKTWLVHTRAAALFSLWPREKQNHIQWTKPGQCAEQTELTRMWSCCLSLFSTWVIFPYLKVSSPSASRGLENPQFLSKACISDTVVLSQLGALPSTRGREHVWLLQQ